MKAYPIDFVRQILEQTLLEQSIDHEQYIGGSDQVSIKSFYEQVQTQEQVDRFVETFRDLTDQANRTGLIANGIISLSENPTITNVKHSLVIPMNWNCMIRCTMKDRDIVVDSINNMISKLKGRKVDIAEFSDGEVFAVGTVGSVENGTYSSPHIKKRDYIGEIFIDDPINSQVLTKIAGYSGEGVASNLGINGDYLYADDGYGNMITLVYDRTLNEWKVGTEDTEFVNVDTTNIIWCPTGKTFEPYKVSLSFDSIRVDEPKTLNGEELMYISFSGSATLTNSMTKLGNDLTCVKFTKSKIITSSGSITLSGNYYLDPLELPSDGSISSTINHISRNGFIPNTHANTLSPTIQYSFLIDEEDDLLTQLFEYSRYGIVKANNNGISPNMIFAITEYWCYWGYVKNYTYFGKIVESIPVENTESDVMTIQLSLEIQGANN